MIATPSDPYLYRFEGKIPALKNGKEVSATRDGKLIFRSNKEVTQWYKAQPRMLQRDIELNAGLDKLVRPFCVLELYAYASVYPLDTDNVYTTVQELMQPPDPNDKEKGFLNIVNDDKDVEHHCVFTYDFNLEMQSIGAFLWVWESTGPDVLSQLQEWKADRARHLQRYKRQTLSPMFGE